MPRSLSSQCWVALFTCATCLGGFLNANCSDNPTVIASTVSLQLDVPSGVLAPERATSVEITIHSSDGATTMVRTANVESNGFKLGDFPVETNGWIEAKLRNQSGGLLGYGRSFTNAKFADGGTIVVQVRRPIVYLGAATVTFSGIPNVSNMWAPRRVVVADLSQSSRGVTGDETIGTTAGHIVAVGAEMFVLDQLLSNLGVGSGKISVASLSSSDHQVGPKLDTAITGAIRDAVGADDGSTIAVATSTGAWLIQVQASAAEPIATTTQIATGSFDRIAMTGQGNTLEIFTLSDRVKSSIACTNGASATLDRFVPGTESSWQKSLVANGSISDLASNGTRLFYSEFCSGKIIESANGAAKDVRKTMIRPVEIVANDSQVWMASVSAQGVSIDVITLGNEAPPTTLFSESLNRAFATADILNIQRTVAATTAEIANLTLIGGEFLALQSYVTYDAPSLRNVIAFEAETQRSWFIATSNGAVQTRYDSWCEEAENCRTINEICNWTCAATAGVSNASVTGAHRVRTISATFGRH